VVIHKKAMSQMGFVIVGLVLALLVLVIMSFISGGVIKNFLESIGNVETQVNDDAACQVLLGGSNDKDGDGLHDTKKKSDGTRCDENPP